MVRLFGSDLKMVTSNNHLRDTDWNYCIEKEDKSVHKIKMALPNTLKEARNGFH
jgi:hypothetical protein